MKLRPYIHKPRAAVQTSYSPAAIAQAYGFPTGLKSGGVIAIIELGGGWVGGDIAAFCQKFGVPVPLILDVPCDASNSPGGDADGEVALDIEVAAGIYSYCTGAAAALRIYWATDIAPAVAKIVADVKAGVKISAVSISWGAAEDVWGEAAANAADAAIAQLLPLGIPFFAAAGDNDSGDGEAGQHVDFPASSPHAIGCGGTTKTAASEVVWNNGPGEGTGGGYSTLFAVPAWQSRFNINQWRMVPDVAANADPHTGYEVYFQGQWQVVGGTSAVAPLFASLFAAVNPSAALLADVPGGNCTVRDGGTQPGYWVATFTGRDAGANALLWADPGAFVDITQGGNGAFHAAPGPDACTGLGVPNGAALVQLLSSGTPVPQPVPMPQPNPSPAPAPQPTPPGHGHHHRHGHRHDAPAVGRCRFILTEIVESFEAPGVKTFKFDPNPIGMVSVRGSFRIITDDPATLAQFKIGQSYYFDPTPAPQRT